MFRTARKLLTLLCLCAIMPPGIRAQHAADPAARYYRVVALVHVVGTGKANDPIRPEYAPTAIDAKREGILAWSFQLTDDKTMAIVHMVAVNHHAFDAILADKRPEIQVYEIGKTPRAAIELAMGAAKAGFDLSKFTVVAQ